MNKERVFIGDAGRLRSALRQALDYTRFSPAHQAVIIKPNLVRAFRSGSGNITDVKVVRALIDVLLARYSIDRIFIAESACLTQNTRDAFRSGGYDRLEGYKKVVTLVDLKEAHYGPAEGFLRKPGFLRDKTLINVPVLKGHPQVTMTCALKNLKGLCCDEDKKRIHRLGLNAHLRHLEAWAPDLNVVDAVTSRHAFGPGGVSRLNRIIAGRDPVLVDAVAARMVGLRIEEMPYLSALFHEKRKILGTNRPVTALEHWPAFDGRVSLPAADLYPGDSCNLCLEAAVKAAGARKLQEKGLNKIRGRSRRIIARMTGGRLFKPADDMAATNHRPLIVIGRQASGIRLPRGRRVLWAGDCARDNRAFEAPGLGGCPPPAEDMRRAMG